MTPPRSTVIAASGLVALLAAGGAALAIGQSGPADPLQPGRSARVLASFTSCDELLRYYRTHGARLVTQFGLPDPDTPMLYTASGTAAEAQGAAGRAAVPSATPALAGDSAANTSEGTGSSGTNVQVAGVDEPDVAKRSGDLLLTVAPTDGYAGVGVATADAPASSLRPADRTSRALVPGLRILRVGRGTVTPVSLLRAQDWIPDHLLVDGSTVLLLGAAPATTTATATGVTPTMAPGTPGYAPSPLIYRPRTRIQQVDVSDPARPRLLRTLDVDGTQVGARLAGGVARLAVRSGPHLPQIRPQGTWGSPPPGEPSGTAGDRAALERNRSIIAASALDQWLPSFTLTDGTGRSARTSTGHALGCDRVAAPDQFSGLNTLSLLTFDLRGGAGLKTWDGAGVVASGSTLYATAEHTYVATSPWQSWDSLRGAALERAAAEQRSWIHEFATDSAGAPRYLASGAVPGFLLNQFAMDEYRGDLRVATTRRPQWMSPGVISPGVAVPDVAVPDVAVPDVAVPDVAVPDVAVPEVAAPDAAGGGTSVGASVAAVPTGPQVTRRQGVDSSQVTVLRRSGDRLEETGTVGGLGATEEIYAVRFAGPIGYVVTFRQTDPLYTIDLSDPAHPKVAGELKLLGYSAYLHPVGDGLLLGVGQDATASGRRTGLAMSLFDVHDPATPRLLSRVRLPEAWTEVESDHHAFTYADGLALVPFSREVVDPGPTGAMTQSDAGVIAVRVTGQELTPPVILRALSATRTGTAPDPTSGQGQSRPYRVLPTPLRTFVGGGDILTVTTSGVAVHDQAGLSRRGFTPYPE